MKRVFLLALLNLVVLCSLMAQSSEQAENYYKSGEYDKAIEEYNAILNGGESSAALYFNLANSYYKAGENTKAIINYERAKLLAPRDKDIEYNLALARKGAVDKIETLPEIFFVRWYNSFVDSISVDGWGYFSVSLFILFLILLAMFLFSRFATIKKIGFFLGIVVLAGTIWSITVAHKRYSSEIEHNGAIIVAPSVAVKSSPDNSGTDLFVVHEGLKVEIISTIGSWYNVRLADGNEGWISSSDLERI
ncbi:MAG: tetratricopeptide repeat protein [Marinifilaceae bacterium]|nr:tetratricopeptide repeat protein [Marinifilaceae bacterium]